MSLSDTIAQQQSIIEALLRKLHRPSKSYKKGERKNLGTIQTPLVDYCFDLVNLRIVYLLKGPNLRVAKHYNEHAMRIMHGRIIRDPDGDYARECIAQAHWGLLKPTKDNYPL